MVLIIQADAFLEKVQFLDVLGVSLLVVFLACGLARLILVELQLATKTKRSSHAVYKLNTSPPPFLTNIFLYQFSAHTY